MKRSAPRHEESEPRHAPERYLALLDRIAARVRPDDSALEPWFRNYRLQHRGRLARDLHILGQHVEPGACVLECGAVPLLTTAALDELGYEVRAVDLAPERFAETIASLDLAVQKCDFETEPLPFADQRFDAVVFNEVFEHLRINPITTMREVRRVLAPGGLLFLSTPNLRSFRGLRNLLLRGHASSASTAIYEQYEKLETLGHMGHVREYTSREIAEFLSRVGFGVHKIIYRGGYGSGLVGLAERLAPSLRPFFTLIAFREEPRG